ncbi:hypothetical protein JW851_03430 [Candidatus Woesearchaeota archaeon]|nr:hypothetical protein [Candidatus Woesearchaeota archaeon]
MDYRERILELVKNSPVQPTGLGKILNKDSLMTSAMLSEMSSKGLLKISNLKIGSSPLYYSPEHPEHLLNYLQSLNEKDRKTAELLREKQVLQDSSLSPLQKVCMKNIRDFALPLEVTMGDSKEIFWKWFLLTDDEAGDLIKNLLKSVPEPDKEVVQDVSKLEPEKKAGLEKPKQKLRKPKFKTAPADKIEPKAEPELTSEPEFEKIEKQYTEPQRIIGPVFVDMGDPFLKKVKSFFDNNNITIHEVNTIKKKTEFDLVVEIPTPIGNLFYFCKAKNNKRISNSDLSSAFVQGQLKKLPVVFLSPGILSKPAITFMKDLKGLTVTKL